MLDVTIWTALLAGLASFLSPCVLPLVPPYLCYIGGVSLDQMTSGEGPTPEVRRSVIYSSIAFALGLGTTFMAIGMTAALLWDFVGENQTLLTRIAGAIIVVMGLHFLGVIKVPLFYREARVEVKSRPAGLIGAYILGLAFGLGWSPCAGPILGAIVMLGVQQEDVWRCVGLLAVYAVGMGVPFVIVAAMMGPFMRWMTRFRRHLGKVEKGLGVFLVCIGALFITGRMNQIGVWMQQNIPWFQSIG